MQWLEKMGIAIACNAALEQFEFEYKDVYMFL